MSRVSTLPGVFRSMPSGSCPPPTGKQQQCTLSCRCLQRQENTFYCWGSKHCLSSHTLSPQRKGSSLEKNILIGRADPQMELDAMHYYKYYLTAITWFPNLSRKIYDSQVPLLWQVLSMVRSSKHDPAGLKHFAFFIPIPVNVQDKFIKQRHQLQPAMSPSCPIVISY